MAVTPADAVAPANAGDSTGQFARDPHLTRSIDLVRTGDFEGAARELKGLEQADGVTGKVRDWLLEFQKLQEARRELNQQDFEKYEGYAKARIEREEFRRALYWVRRAADVAENKDAFLGGAWVRTLVANAMKEADVHRDAHNWIPAYNVYSNLADLYEREPRYKKLENEVLTHLRLDIMFDKKGRSDERLERIRWDDAEDVLGYIERWYFA